MGFINSDLEYLYNYPCANFTLFPNYDPISRLWYIEA